MQRKLSLLVELTLIAFFLFTSSVLLAPTTQAGAQNENLALIEAEIEGIGAQVAENAVQTSTRSQGTDIIVEEVFGNTSFTYTGGTRMRGNIFQVDSTVNLVEQRMYFTIPAATNIYYVVYESTTATGVYTLYHSILLVSGTGQGWHSSGPIDVTLNAGRFYLIGASWEGSITYHCGTTPPNPCSFGSQIHNVQPSPFYPPDSTYTGTIYSVTAYYQTIVTSDEGGDSLIVTLTPHNPPIQIPPGGGQLVFDAEIQNISSSQMVFDGWTEVVLPNGSTYGPLVLRTNLPINPGQTIMRIVTQNVPGAAPAGNYTYVGNAGIHPDSVINSDSFDFAKLAGDAASNSQGWTVSGWFGDETAMSIDNYALSAAFPNPFNPTTNISFTLPEAGKITLSVFDVNGREVAVLANGWLNSGAHQVVFDGCGLASGIYFYRLTAGDFSTTQKMVLLK